MAILPNDPAGQGKALFDGGQTPYTADDSADRKNGGGAYDHNPVDGAATWQQAYTDWLLYISSLLNGTATAADPMGFYGVGPVTQPAAAAQHAITNSTGGTPSATYVLVDCGASYNRANLNDNFSTLFVLLDTMRTALTATGIMKGSA